MTSRVARQNWAERARPGRRLVAVAAVLAALLCLAGSFLAWAKYEARLASERRELVNQARGGAAEASRFLADRLRLLEALGSDTSFGRDDLEDIASDLANLPTDDVAFTGGVLWSDADGRVITGRGALAEDDTALPSRPWLDQVLESGEPTVSGVTTDPAFTGDVVVVAVPTLGPRGARGVLAGGLGLDWIRQLVNGLPMSEDGRALVVDDTGQVIASSEREGAPAGTAVAPATLDAVGAATGPGGDGPGSGDLGRVPGGEDEPDQVAAFATVDAADWRVLVERQASAVYRSPLVELVVELAALAGIAVVGLAIALVTGRRVDRLADGQRRARLAAEHAARRSSLLQQATSALTTAVGPAEVLRAVGLGLSPLGPLETVVGTRGEDGGYTVHTASGPRPAAAPRGDSGRAPAATAAAQAAPTAATAAAPAAAQLPADSALPGPTVARDGRPRWWASAEEARAEFPEWSAPAMGAGCCLPLGGEDGERPGPGFLTVVFPRADQVAPGADRRAPGAGELGPGDRALVDLLASQTAQALQRNRQRAVEAAELHRAVALQEATATLSAAVDRASVLRAMVETGRKVLAAEASLLYLAQDGVLVLEESSGATISEIGPLARRPLAADSPLAVAVAGARPVSLDRPELQARVPEIATLPPRVPRGAFLAVPLPRYRQPGAFVFLYDKARRADNATVATAGTLAELCVQALRRADLAEEERARRHRAEQLQRVITSLANTSTSEDVARSALEGGAAVLGATTGTFAVLERDDPDQLRLLFHQGIEPEVASRHASIAVASVTPLANAARNGEPVYVTTPEELARDFPLIVADARTGDRVSWACLPLVTGGRTLGVLGFGYDRPQAFEPDERLALETFASRCAEALARAERFETEHEAAVALQRALLPLSLDAPEGMLADARYQPGVHGLLVGGDWYDLSVLEDGRVAASVGDVVGQGTAAAAAMGQLRVADAALAPFAGPAEVLTRLEQLSRTIPGAHMATAAHLVLNPATGELVYSLAGHPPPVLRRADGTVTLLQGGRGTPLAPELARARGEATLHLERGSLLVLYTDGLIERRDRSIDSGLDQLVAAIAARPHDGPQALCDAVLAELLEDSRARDDVAVLCMELLARPRLEYRAPGRSGSLSGARHALQDWLVGIGAEDQEVTDLVLAAGEACANAVEHAAGAPSRAELQLDGVLEADDTVRLTIRDSGRWVERPARPGRGLGLGIMAAVVDELELTRGTGAAMGTTVVLRRRLNAGPRGPGARSGSPYPAR